MKKFFHKLIKILSLVLLCVLAHSALAYTSPGKPTGFVNDYAGVLDQNSKQKLESDLANLEKQTGVEFSVVIIKNLDGDTVENYANLLFNEWGIGKKATNKGLLLLISMEDRKTRFEVGYGLEGTLPDLLTSKIQQNYLLPSFKARDYVGGIQRTVLAVEEILNGDISAGDIPDTQAKTSSGDGWWFLIYPLFIMFIFIIQFLIYSMARSKSFWLGGAIFGSIGFMASQSFFWFFPNGTFSFFTHIVAVIGISFVGTIFGLFVDYKLSKKGAGAASFSEFLKKNSKRRGGGIFFGGGSSGGSSFGGFSGGSSGGGGSSGSW